MSLATRLSALSAMAAALALAGGGSALGAAPPTLVAAGASGVRTSALVTGKFVKCKDEKCRRRVLLTTRPKTAAALTALRSSRLQSEETCNATWATMVEWGLTALDEASAAARKGDRRLAAAKVRAAVRRAGRGRVVQESCWAGVLTAETGRFAACVRAGAGQICRSTFSRTLTAVDVATGSPQLVTRVVCLGRPFRGHWELRVTGRQPVDSATFVACRSRTHEDFVVPLDLKTIGFPFDQRLPSRTFDATLRFVDDDLDRSEGEAVYGIRFAELTGAEYSQGVRGDWTITSVTR